MGSRKIGLQRQNWLISKRKARTGRNPQTGEPIKINAKKVVRFKAGKALEVSINKTK